MKLTFNADLFPEEGIATHSGKLVIVNGATGIDSVEIRRDTVEGQQLQTQYHLGYQQPDHYQGCDTIEILFSAASRGDVVEKIRAGIEVTSLGLWLDALSRQSPLRQNFKVEGLFL